jgi:DNA mismatch repair protein MutS2
VRLIHGRGTGAQRASIHRHLRSHRLVDSFWDAGESHLGATLVKLKGEAPGDAGTQSSV